MMKHLERANSKEDLPVKIDITKVMGALMQLERSSPHDEEEEEKKRWYDMYSGVEFYDDVHNRRWLDRDRVIGARRAEMEYYKKDESIRETPQAP